MGFKIIQGPSDNTELDIFTIEIDKISDNLSSKIVKLSVNFTIIVKVY